MKKRKKILLVFFLFSVAAWTAAAPFLAARLIVERPLERADAIFVFSGSSAYRERTRKAAELFKSGVSGKILLTDDGERGGWSKSEQRNPPFVELARDELIGRGVPAENIEILSPQVTGTVYEARLLADAARAQKLGTVLLVTSAYHTRRALWISEKVLRENELETRLGITAAETGSEAPRPLFWWLSPKGWNAVAGEYVKGFVYWVYY